MSTRGECTQRQETARDISPEAEGAAATTPTSLRRTSARFSRPTSQRTSADSNRSHQKSVHLSRSSYPRRSRSRSPSSPPPPRPQCWAVTWDGEEEEDCVREPLPTPKALQEHLDGWCSTANDVRSTPAAGGIGVATVAEDVRSSDHALGTSEQRRRPRLILRGMAPAFLRVLLDSPLGIDPGFVEAHAARRRYQPSSPRRQRIAPERQKLAAAQWNYPELVSGINQGPWARGGRRTARGENLVLPIGDVMGGEAVRAVSNCEDLAAVECRVSVWVAEKVDVLFLDLPVWENPRSFLRKGRREKMDVTRVEGEEATPEKLWDAFIRAQEEGEGEEIPSLEDVLQETLSLSADAEGSKLVDILEEAAYDKWLDFFEVLTPRQNSLIADGTSIEWRALQALEGNLDMAKRLSHHHRRQAPAYASYPDWPSLLQRLRDRAALLATIPPKPPIPSPPPNLGRRKGRNLGSFHADNFTNLPVPPRRRARSPKTPAKSGDGGGSDPNQRALDRVTYLGGILLPISITSSVLSMNEDFEPGQPLFWVFWAAAVPLTVLTFVVIYADKLRSSEVWEEIGSLGSSGGSVLGEQTIAEEKAEAEIEEGRTSMKKRKTERIKMHEEAGYPEQERWKKKTSTRHRRTGTTRPQAMAYAGQEEIVIDLSDVIEQPIRPVSLLEPRTSSQQQQQQQQQQQPDEDMGPRPPSPPVVIDDSDDEYDDLEDDEAVDPNMYISRPTNGTRPHAWRKKQLGWAGAAKCMLGMQRPLRVEDGLPVVPEQRRDVERRLRQVRRRASVEGRRSLSF